MPDEKEKIKIPHHRSNQFTSHFATGTILSGPTPDGMYHLTFYSDVVGINSETGQQVAGNLFQTSIEDSDVSTFREDKARISMNRENLARLAGLLLSRIEIQAEEPSEDDE